MKSSAFLRIALALGLIMTYSRDAQAERLPLKNYTTQREFIPTKRDSAFVLGCGGCALERRAARLGICDGFYGVDISREAIQVARELARRSGLSQFRYQVADANKLALEPDSLDLILADMALHHITELENLLGQFQLALRPGGLLILN